MEPRPAKPLVVQVGELVASFGELTASTQTCPQSDLIDNLARRLRAPRGMVVGAVAQLRDAGVFACQYEPQRPSGQRLITVKYIPTHQRPERAAQRAQVIAPVLTTRELDVLRVLCRFVSADGKSEASAFSIVVDELSLSEYSIRDILSRLREKGQYRNIGRRYQINLASRAVLFPGLPFLPDTNRPFRPSGVDNTLTLDQVGPLDTTCRRFMLILRTEAGETGVTESPQRQLLRDQYPGLYGEPLEDVDIPRHLQHLRRRRLYQSATQGYEVNTTFPVKGDE